MKLPNPVEGKGFFWLPESPQNSLPGLLRISETGEATLEVFGINDTRRSLNPRPFIDPPFSEKYEHIYLKRIVGITETGKSKLITLDKCKRITYSNTYPGLWTSTYRADYAFISANHNTKKESKFSKIEFSVEGLDEWLSITGLNVQHQWEDRRASVEYEHPQATPEIPLSDGISLRFTFAVKLPGFAAIAEAHIDQMAYISLASNTLRPLDDFIDLIFKLQVFLCFAIDKTVSIKTITGYSSEVTQEIGDGKKYETPISIYYRREPNSETNHKIYLHNMFFRYKDIKDNLEKVLNKWIEDYKKYELAFNLYFSVASGAYKYTDGKFLSLVQAIEILHRKISQEKRMPENEFRDLVDDMTKNLTQENCDFFREKLEHANELSLRKRMQRMIDPFQEFFGNEQDRKSFSKKIADTRNYLVHADDNPEKKWVEGVELSKLYYKIEALFQLRLLQMLEFDSEFINSLEKKNYRLRWKLYGSAETEHSSKN